MQEIIKSINKKIDLINSNIKSISNYINSEDWIEECNHKEIEVLAGKVKILAEYHNNFHQMYSLLQSFHYSVSNFDTVFYEEIEQKWLKILINWFNIEEKVPQIDESFENIDIDTNCIYSLQAIMNSIKTVLINDTKGLNRFSLNYLDNKENKLISFSDYNLLYSIKKEYAQKKKHSDEIKQFGDEVLDERDRKTIRINELSIEQYIQFLEERNRNFSNYKSFKGYKLDLLQENIELILSKPFSFNFVKMAGYFNSRTSQKDYFIERIFSYIIEHKNEFGIDIKKDDFEYIIVNKKLPADMNKISWKGIPTDASIFCKLFEIEPSRFNRCFKLSNGKPLKSNSAGKNPQTDFSKFTRNLSIEFDSAI